MPGEVPSILVVKLATTTHQEMESALTTLRASPLVLHSAQDILLGPDALPPSQGDHPSSWEWTTMEGGSNPHFKMSRVPQMWNFNRALEKQGRGTRIGIVDLGFAQHEDLIFETHGLPIDHFHGTVIAGTIGAIHSNDLGVEGIYPFLRLGNPLSGMVTQALPVGLASGGNVLTQLTSLGELMVEGIKLFVTQRPELRGIVSPPLIVVSAGNDNGANARYSSPMTNAALVQGVFNICLKPTNSLRSF